MSWGYTGAWLERLTLSTCTVVGASCRGLSCCPAHSCSRRGLVCLPLQFPGSRMDLCLMPWGSVSLGFSETHRSVPLHVSHIQLPLCPALPTTALLPTLPGVSRDCCPSLSGRPCVCSPAAGMGCGRRSSAGLPPDLGACLPVTVPPVGLVGAQACWWAYGWVSGEQGVCV